MRNDCGACLVGRQNLCRGAPKARPCDVLLLNVNPAAHDANDATRLVNDSTYDGDDFMQLANDSTYGGDDFIKLANDCSYDGDDCSHDGDDSTYDGDDFAQGERARARYRASGCRLNTPRRGGGVGPILICAICVICG